MAERDTDFCIFPSRQGKPFAAISRGRMEAGSDGYHMRGALRREKNTWICATISIFVPSRKGYFCLNFEGLLKAGTLEALGLSESGRF